MATVIAHTPGCPGSNCPTTYAHPAPGMSYVQGGYGHRPVGAGRYEPSRGGDGHCRARLAAGRSRAKGAAMTLADAFDSFTREAWRLEARDVYVVDEYADQLDAFLNGRTLPARSDGWDEVMSTATARGARVGRTRLVGHPITEYTRFEFLLYRENVAMGEDVRIVDRTWLDASWSATPDLWLFDNELALRQHYSDSGVYLGAEAVDPEPVIALRQTLATYAVPVAEYQLTEVPSPRPETAHPAALPRAVRT